MANNLLLQIHYRYLFESCKLLPSAKSLNNLTHQLFYLLEEIMSLSPFSLCRYHCSLGYLGQSIYSAKINAQIIHLTQNSHFYALIEFLNLRQVLQNAEDLQLSDYCLQFQPI